MCSDLAAGYVVRNSEWLGDCVMRQGVFLRCAVAAALITGVAACGARTSPTPAMSPATAPAMPTPAGARDPATASASGEISGIPFYQPSTVITQTGNAVVLKSPDPVTKVTAFYVNAIEKGGWNSVSKTITNYNGNLTVRRPGHGASISISPSGSSSLISISTYPTP